MSEILAKPDSEREGEIDAMVQQGVPQRDEKIRLNAAGSSTLATLRDALLPRLMSGEFRVREAESSLLGAE